MRRTVGVKVKVPKVKVNLPDVSECQCHRRTHLHAHADEGLGGHGSGGGERRGAGHLGAALVVHGGEGEGDAARAQHVHATSATRGNDFRHTDCNALRPRQQMAEETDNPHGHCPATDKCLVSRNRESLISSFYGKIKNRSLGSVCDILQGYNTSTSPVHARSRRFTQSTSFFAIMAEFLRVPNPWHIGDTEWQLLLWVKYTRVTAAERGCGTM